MIFGGNGRYGGVAFRRRGNGARKEEGGGGGQTGKGEPVGYKKKKKRGKEKWGVTFSPVLQKVLAPPRRKKTYGLRGGI